MLISLYVKNLALIDEIELFFDRGLNILTGETGAGKSILMGSIHLALGGKADTNIIRNGKEFALIELLFEVNKEEQKRVIKEFDIPLEEDTLLIQRKILANRSVCKVNGESVSNKQLKELASTFINIHGQHENQSLLKGKTYLDILDDFAIEEVGEYKKSVSEYYKLYKEISKQLEESCMDEKEKNRQINLAEYEVNEIEDAKLKDGEDFLLEEQYKKMVYSQKIVDILSGIYKMVGGDNEHSISNLIGKSLRDIKSISELDTQITTFEEQLITIEEFSFEFIREISNYLESLEYESEALSEVEQRLNVINHLKSKYGNSISEVLLYKEKQESLLSNLKNQDINRKKLEEKLLNVKDKLWKKAKKLSEIRKKQAVELEKLLIKALKELNFSYVDLKIDINQEEHISSKGYDFVEFLISVNPGGEKQPLNKVSSGGELSRIMLALKSIMAKKEEISTLIFDEIDTGISGKTAWKVSQKMGILGREHQILCITHLPQIAAMSDRHFLIEKVAKENTSTTYIRKLQEEEEVLEISRLLAASEVTNVVIENAKELKKMAKDTKK